MEPPIHTVDGISAPTPDTLPESQVDARQVSRWKVLISGSIGIAYAAFLLWCGILLMLLPSTAAYASSLTTLGLLTSVTGAGIIILLGVLSLLHIGKTPASIADRNMALIKLGILVVPGLAFSAFTPYMILQEAPLTIDIVHPVSAEEIVAPVTMTFGVDTAVRALAQRGFRPLSYRWDINGDGKVDSESFEPRITATYDRAGVFLVSVTMVSANRETRVARRRVVISQAVFSVTPVIPIVNMPVVFDLSNLATREVSIVSAEWDFDDDGIVDETIAGPRVTHTFFRTGRRRVSVLVRFSNNTHVTYARWIDVQEPPPLPFPVQIITDPKHLVSTAPFTAMFTIETEEQIANVQWQFGDGGRGEGMRVTHTFTRNGNYPVQARVRSLTGSIADVSTMVSVVERLDLPDLRFEGTPNVSGGRIQGEVPLSINLRPVTARPFVTFLWEAPNATETGRTEGELQAIYRREGTYTITLIGTDVQNRVLRMPITVDVRPPSAILSFKMEPEAGVAPLTVQFDASETTIPGDDITGFIWGFGSGRPKEYGGAFMEHTFDSAGTYVIDLTVRTSGGRQQSITRTLVVRAPVIQACILPSRLRGQAPLGVELSSACSTGDIRRVLWDFGDGSQSDEREPVHVFLSPGTYPVRLTVTDASGSSHSTMVTLTAE